MKSLIRVYVHVWLLIVLTAAGVCTPSTSARAALPPNDDFANAVDLGRGLTASASGTNLWATAQAGEPGQLSGPATASVWYRWTAPESRVADVQTCGSNFNTRLAVFRGPAFGALGRVAANDDACRSRSAVRFFSVAGTTYHIAVDGRRGAQRWIELRLRSLSPPPNDDFANAVDLGSELRATASGTNRDATVEPREPVHPGNAIASVWYRWTAPASRRFQIVTCGSSFDTVISVLVGPGLNALRPVARNDDRCETQSIVRLNARAGTTYHIAVAGYERAQGSFRLRLAPQKRVRR